MYGDSQMCKQVYFLASPLPATMLHAYSAILAKTNFSLPNQPRGWSPYRSRATVDSPTGVLPPFHRARLLPPRLSAHQTQRLTPELKPCHQQNPPKGFRLSLFSARGIFILLDEHVVPNPRLVSEKAGSSVQ